MNKYYYLIVVFAVAGLLAASSWAAAPVSLETQLEQLQAPVNGAPSAVSGEKLYSVQTRYSPLRNHVELSLGGAKNFSTNGYLSSHQIDLGARYYFSDRWFVGASGSYVFNQASAFTEAMIATQGFAPDVASTKFRGELLGGFNLFYGKFRLSMDKVFYFDQYIAIGPGLVNFVDIKHREATNLAAVADVGLVLWFGRQASLRVGVKDYFFKEERSKSAAYVNHFVGHFQLGYLL